MSLSKSKCWYSNCAGPFHYENVNETKIKDKTEKILTSIRLVTYLVRCTTVKLLELTVTVTMSNCHYCILSNSAQLGQTFNEDLSPIK
jgi:hypothetical protein